MLPGNQQYIARVIVFSTCFSYKPSPEWIETCDPEKLPSGEFIVNMVLRYTIFKSFRTPYVA